MSQKHTPGAIKATEEIFPTIENTAMMNHARDRAATIIDSEAVQPAVKELLEALKKIKKILTDPDRVMPCLAVDVAAFALAKFDPPVDTETESKERGDPSTEA